MKDPASWQEHSRLLDEALALAAGEQAGWLAALAETKPEAAAAVARLLGHLNPPTKAASTGQAAALLSGGLAAGALLAAALPEAADAARPGQNFGPWRVSRKLGAGGMGEVWLAQRADQLYEGQAAIKLLRERGERRRLEARFARERRVLGRLNHRGIARLLDAGVAGEQPYLVLEYVEGELLTDHARARQLTLAARLRLLLQVAQAVDYAHDRLIVHRDLKPSNVMVTAGSEVKLLDFGIAGLLDDEPGEQAALTQLFGRGLTPEYAAPEQIAGEATGVACDVYALGVLIFELLSGEPPFSARGISRAALEHAVLHTEAPRLGRALAKPLPATAAAGARPADAARAGGDVEAIVAKCLRKSPDERYHSVAALIADLQNWLARRPTTAGRDDWRYRARLWLRRNWLPASLAAATFAALAVGLGTSLLLYGRASEARQKAEFSAGESDAVRQFLFNDLLAGVDPHKLSIKDLRMVDVLARASQQVEGRFPQQPRLKALVYSALADSYLALQRNTEAADNLGKALALADRHPDRISARDRLSFLKRQALALRNSSQLPAALAASLASEAGWQRLVPSGQSSDLALAEIFSGGVLVELGRYAEAQRTLERASKRALALQPPDDALADYARFWQSEALMAAADYPAALALLQACVAYAEQGPDANHFSAAVLRTYLGAAYLKNGRYQEAEAALAAAESALAEQVGEDHAQLDLIFATQGELRLAQGQPAQALVLLEKSRARILAHYGAADLGLVQIAPPLVDALLQTGQPRLAEQEAAEKLALALKTLGPKHFRTLALQLSLASSQRALGERGAERATLESAAAAARLLPDQHPLHRRWRKALDEISKP